MYFKNLNCSVHHLPPNIKNNCFEAIQIFVSYYVQYLYSNNSSYFPNLTASFNFGLILTSTSYITPYSERKVLTFTKQLTWPNYKVGTLCDFRLSIAFLTRFRLL